MQLNEAEIKIKRYINEGLDKNIILLLKMLKEEDRKIVIDKYNLEDYQ